MKARILTLLVGLPFLFILEAHSQIIPEWQSLDGPGEANVRSLDISSSGLIFTTTESGIHVSPDAGTNWDRYRYGNNRMFQAALASNEIAYYIRFNEPDSTSEFSRNGTYTIITYGVLGEDPARGITGWSCCRNLDFPATGAVTNIPTASDGSGYVGIGYTVWYYIGWGYGYSKHHLPVDQIHQLYWDGEGEAYAATTDGVFAFEEPWKEIPPRNIGPDSTGAYHAVHHMADGTLAVGAGDGSLYLQEAGSASWEAVAIDSTEVRAILETNAGTWLVGSREGVYASESSGASWTKTALSAPITSLHEHPLVSVLFAVTAEGDLFISEDEGETWRYATWRDSDIELLHLDSDGMLLAAEKESDAMNGLQRYEASTGTWTPLGLNIGRIQAINTLPNGTYLAVTCDRTEAYEPFCELKRSLDAGETWASMYTFEDESIYYDTDLVAVDNRTLLVRFSDGYPDDYKVMRSTDGGQTWERLDELTNDEPTGIHLASNGNLYAYTRSGPTLLRSTDQGKTWRTIRQLSTPPAGFIWRLTSTPNGHLIAAFSDGRTIDYYRSANGGADWVATGLPAGEIQYSRAPRLYSDIDGTVYITHAHVLHRSQDGGITWTSDPEFFSRLGFPNRPSLVDADGNFFIGTEQGVYTWNEGFIATATESETAIPTTLQVHSVYPNPLRGNGYLNLDVVDAGIVHINAFDVLGREVAQLHNAYLHAGPHHIPIALDVPAGLYILTAEQGNLRSTVKVVVR